jgi:hypothetical protein
MPSRPVTDEEAVLMDTLYEMVVADLNEAKAPADLGVSVLLRIILEVLQRQNLYGFEVSVQMFILGIQEEVRAMALEAKKNAH